MDLLQQIKRFIMFYSYYTWTELAYIDEVLGTRLPQWLETVLKVLAEPLRSCLENVS